VEIEPEREQATADIIGGLAYALLRVFQVTARVVGSAPTLALAERQAAFAIEEFERYRILRRRLNTLTRDVESSLERFRAPLDAFYEHAPTEWLDAQVFQYIGDRITTDFAEMLAPALDERSAVAVDDALTGRAAHDAFALEQIELALATEPDAQTRVASVAGRIVGEALTRLRETLLDSNALALVLGGEEAVKDLVLELLARHRERLDRLGVDRVD
jgi:hypothetical protein